MALKTWVPSMVKKAIAYVLSTICTNELESVYEDMDGFGNPVNMNSNKWKFSDLDLRDMHGDSRRLQRLVLR